ncbi:MAG: replication initiator protein A [Bacteroidota bacterium]
MSQPSLFQDPETAPQSAPGLSQGIDVSHAVDSRDAVAVTASVKREAPDPYGRDELNLIELAFTTLGRARSRKTLKTEWRGKDHKGRTRKFYKVVTGSDEFGLPEYASEELLIAFFHKASRDDFEARSITAVPYELLKLMGWGTDGRAYGRLKRALDQLAGVYITTNALWNAEKGTYSKSGFHVLDDYEFVEDPKSGHTSLTVNWNEKLFSIFRQSRFKRLDTQFFYNLPTPVAKRLFRWLDKHLRKTGHAEIDVIHLAHVKLEISHSKRYVSQVMQVLQPALDALTDRGYCTWALMDSQTDSGKKLVFDRIRDSALPPPDLGEEPSHALSPAQRARQDALVDRGVSSGSARDLVLKHPLATIDRQLQHFDHLVSEDAAPKSSGWLIAAVEKNYGLPPTLLVREKRARSSAEEDRRQAEVAADRERRQAKARTDAAAKRSARSQALAELLGTQSTETLAALEAAAVARLDPINRSRYREHGLDALGVRDLVEIEVLALLRERHHTPE